MQDSSSPPPECAAAPVEYRAHLLSVLWESAAEAFVQAILVTVLGGVAVNILSGIWGHMTPSLPPGLGSMTPAADAVARWTLWAYLQQHRFVIIFCAILGLKTWGRLAGWQTALDTVGSPLSRTQKIGKQVAGDWFRLIIGNAFGALVSALLLTWVQQFSLRFWFRRWIVGSVLGFLHDLAASVLGTGGVNALGSWFGWYGENQLKLMFWLFYVAAICDDLGIPNLKTLGRWSWRHWHRTGRHLRCYG
ncbi:MAG TPA: hypothetical protein VHI52_22235 [Verrucomicrobiae bacterium]|nr:hypothetical protein [Verrucomicrobiae bacterium]